MIFRKGDLVEVVAASRFHDWVGRELVVTEVGCEYVFFATKCWRYDGVKCSPQPDNGMWAPEHLRLKRPKSWNEWLLDTQHVKDEQEEMA